MRKDRAPLILPSSVTFATPPTLKPIPTDSACDEPRRGSEATNVSFPLSPREERGALRGPGMEQGVGRIVHTHTHAESQRLKQQCSYLTLSQESSSPSDSHLETALEQGNVRPHNLPSTHLHTSGRQEGQAGKVIKRHKQWKDK